MVIIKREESIQQGIQQHPQAPDISLGPYIRSTSDQLYRGHREGRGEEEGTGRGGGVDREGRRRGGGDREGRRR